MDINLSTYKRELESSSLTEAEKSAKLATFSALKTPEGRCDALRQLRGGSVTSKAATKLGGVSHTR